MIILAGTNHVLKVVTSSTSAVDVHVSWMDLSGASATPGVTDTVISSATTTTICVAPAAATTRAIKSINIFVRGAAANTVTVSHDNGTTVCTMLSRGMSAETVTYYTSGVGWTTLDRNGQQVNPIIYSPTVTVGATQMWQLTDDFATSATGAVLLPQLQFDVVANATYFAEFRLFYEAAATTTGLRATVIGPLNYDAPAVYTEPNFCAIFAMYSGSTTQWYSGTHNGYSNVFGRGAAAAQSGATTANTWIGYAQFNVPSSGDCGVHVASEISGSAITIKSGSTVHWSKLT